MEHQAVELIGRKQQAAALLYGDSTSGGLSALNGSDGGNLLAALAAEIDGDSSVTDLRDLFARANTEVDPAESAWFAEEVTGEAEASLEPTPDENDPLLRFLVEDCGGVIVKVEEAPASETPTATAVRVALPPRQKRVHRRRALNLLDVPQDDPTPVKIPLPSPIRQSRVLQNPAQLALL